MLQRIDFIAHPSAWLHGVHVPHVLGALRGAPDEVPPIHASACHERRNATPAARGTTDAVKEPSKSTSDATMKPSARILIVDDEEVVRLSYMRTLAGAECQVKAVWTWAQVRQAMDEEPFDVVLLDLRMPGMDGLDVLRALKQKWPDSEVVIITGYPTLSSAKEAVTLGAYDYLTKPVGPEQVIEAANAAMLHKLWALHDDNARTARTDQETSAPEAAGFPSSPIH
jgi:CheY-like chemotaxis protein